MRISKQRQSLAIVIGLGGMLLLITVGWLPYRYEGESYMYPPVFIGGCFPSLGKFIENIAGEKGLPRLRTTLIQCGEFESSTALYPVKWWEIKKVYLDNLHGPLSHKRLYQIIMEVEVEYRDWGRGVLCWKAWNYGYHIGPLVVNQGIGPPWEVSPDSCGNIHPGNGLR